MSAELAAKLVGRIRIGGADPVPLSHPKIEQFASGKSGAKPGHTGRLALSVLKAAKGALFTFSLLQRL